jgi:mono/diheme cytochrome c family protein
MRRSILILVILLFAAPSRADEGGAQFFEAKIRPLLAEHCFSCHSARAKKLKADLYLDSRAGALKGGESGPAIVPGSPQTSRLIEAVNYKNVDLQMPPKDKLTDAQIADLTAWVKMGAPWGQVSRASPVARVEAFDLQKRKATHWAWQPVKVQTPPPVRETTWPRNPIDQFILAKLEAAGVQHAPPADPRTLLRRLYFDLIGLAPSPEELDAFLHDSSPDAYEKVVDRLLASPRFGERWGRHWLDLVRYSETMGHEFDYAISNAWRYRDYVIRAFNQDVPYNQFVTEHVAGDLLKNPRRAPDGTNQSVIGTGFWFLGEGTHSPVDLRQWQADTFDNRIDVFGKTFLGLTVACARCHDHKFDAISTADYYSMYGYLKGLRYTQTAINDRAIASSVSGLQEVKDKLRRTIADDLLTHLEEPTSLPALAQPDHVAATTEIDLAPPHLPGWRTDGAAFTITQPGDFLVGDDQHPIASLLTTTVAHSALISRKLEGALRSPTFTLDKRYLHVRAAGDAVRMNLVVDNFVIIRDPIYGSLKQTIKHDKPAWLTIDLKMWQGHQAYLEFEDHSVPDPSMTSAPTNGWLVLERAILSDQAHPPAAQKPGERAPLLRSTVEQWRDADPITDPAQQRALAATLEQLTPTPTTTSLLRDYRTLEKSIPAPVYALAASDGQAPDEHIFIRGNPKTLGPITPRRLLEALSTSAGLRTHDSALRTRNSRLTLAAQLTDPANPLTARVMANRVWHHLFGRGIVPSVDNFGALGEKPSHPELLDYLATDFVQHNWSIKHLIRTIVLTSTYQQSSTQDSSGLSASKAALSTQDSSLFARQSTRRLEAEIIRDHLLDVAGQLDLTMGGPSVKIHLTPFMEGRGRPGVSGPLDGAGRRSIYVEIRRNFLSPMLLAFDTPAPFNTMGRRTISNVPAQALILMNDPFVHHEADLWAQRILADNSLTTQEARITRMYLTAFSRPPTPQELSTVEHFLDQQRQDPWPNLAHALINTKEFIYIN